MGPWTDLVLMCLISCFRPALGEPVHAEPAGVVFDQSSWGALGWAQCSEIFQFQVWGQVFVPQGTLLSNNISSGQTGL